MVAPRLLVFGTESDLQSPLVQKLRAFGNVEWVLRDKVPPPTKEAAHAFRGAVLVWKESPLQELSGWTQWIQTHQLKVVVLVAAGELPVAIRAAFSPIKVIKGHEALDQVLQSFGLSGSVEPGILSLSVSRSSVEEELPPVGDGDFSAGSDASISVMDLSSISPLPSGEDEPVAESSSMAGADPVALNEELLSVLDQAPIASSVESASAGNKDPFADLLQSGPFSGGASSGTSPGIPFNPSQAPLQGSADDLWSAAMQIEPEPERTPEGISDQAWGQPVSQVVDTSVKLESSEQPLAVDDLSEELGAVADSHEAEAESRVPEIHSSMVEELNPPPTLGRAPSLDEYQTLQRYAALKEREAREKDGGIQALNRQIEQVRDRLAKSETERRRLTMALDDSEGLRRSLEDEREQNKHHINKAESAHQEELRGFQLRLDNTQFQASRAEKKLEEFRERVRADIQKIRARERELANRLELQKRDAEALLAAKDERLLQQKREIDRLEFEVDSLRERLVEQTQKAEERVARLSRAVKALKMAQGMLSGIEDEVLPNAAASSDGGEEAA